MRPSLKKVCIVFILLLLPALAGCTPVAQVAAPEVQAVSAVDTQKQSVVETDRIYDGISVNGIQIGGLTKEEATKKLNEELLSPLKNQKIIVINGDKTWPLELESLAYKFEIEKAVGDAYAFARTGTTDERYDKIMELQASPHEIVIEPSYNKSAIDSFLTEIAAEVDKPPVEATVTRENKEFLFTAGENGERVDKISSKAAISELADKLEGGEVALALESVPPKFTEDELRKANQLLGEYSTPITGSASRDVNLTVASGYINGVTVYPGEVFSTNETIGPTTYERGYRSAPVIVNGKLEDGIGGGVCQVSSTLYNAVLFSELEIVQRRNHSLVVGYIPIGRDATLAGDIIDLKFKNDTDYPIYIESYLEGKQLFVSIYGYETRPENRKIDFESVYVGSAGSAGEVEIPDPTLPLGERVVVTAALSGQVVDVYKIVTIDGVLADRTFVDRSTYRARAGEVRVGTGEAVPAEAAEVPTEPEAPVMPEPEIDNSIIPEWIDVRPQDFEPEPDEPWWPADFN